MKKFIKEHMKLFSILMICSAAMCLAQCEKAPPQLGKVPVNKVVAAMTLEEKASLVVGEGMNLVLPYADRCTYQR